MMGTYFWLKILNGPWLGGFEGFLVRNCGGEVLVRSYGFLVRRSGKGYLSVHQTGPGSGIGFLLGYPDGIILGRVNRCELGASDGDSLRNVELAPDWLYGRVPGLQV